MTDKQDLYRSLIDHLNNWISDDLDVTGAMSTFVAVLHEQVDYFDWTGYYRRVDPTMLEIGPYQGHVACTRIPIERGVCGAAARRAETVIVADVTTFEGYIACDSTTKSEIVVPLIIGGQVNGVLDVDSNRPHAFDQQDREGLEELLRRFMVPKLQ